MCIECMTCCFAIFCTLKSPFLCLFFFNNNGDAQIISSFALFTMMLFLFIVIDCSFRVFVQPSCRGKSKRDAVYATGLAPQLPGPAQRREWREEGHGKTAVSEILKLFVSNVFSLKLKLGVRGSHCG